MEILHIISLTEGEGVDVICIVMTYKKNSDVKEVKQFSTYQLTLINACLQGHYHGFVTGATEVIYSDSGRLPSDALQQITARGLADPTPHSSSLSPSLTPTQLTPTDWSQHPATDITQGLFAKLS